GPCQRSRNRSAWSVVIPASFQSQLALRESASGVLFRAPGLHGFGGRPRAALVFGAVDRGHQDPVLPVRKYSALGRAIPDPAKDAIGLVRLHIAESALHQAATKLLL